MIFPANFRRPYNNRVSGNLPDACTLPVNNATTYRKLVGGKKVFVVNPGLKTEDITGRNTTVPEGVYFAGALVVVGGGGGGGGGWWTASGATTAAGGGGGGGGAIAYLYDLPLTPGSSIDATSIGSGGTGGGLDSGNNVYAASNGGTTSFTYSGFTMNCGGGVGGGRGSATSVGSRGSSGGYTHSGTVPSGATEYPVPPTGGSVLSGANGGRSENGFSSSYSDAGLASALGYGGGDGGTASGGSGGFSGGGGGGASVNLSSYISYPGNGGEGAGGAGGESNNFGGANGATPNPGYNGGAGGGGGGMSGHWAGSTYLAGGTFKGGDGGQGLIGLTYYIV